LVCMCIQIYAYICICIYTLMNVLIYLGGCSCDISESGMGEIGG